jgi:hypothetical protein
MRYIIDANNLAGKFKILNEKNFDLKLIGIIENFFTKKSDWIDLIFDGCDVMGDRYCKKNINIIYAPKDSYYHGADDKIVELVAGKTKDLSYNAMSVVTDDLELIERVQIISRDVKIVKAIDFMKAVLFFGEIKSSSCDSDDLSVEEENDVTTEMLKIWC